MIRPKDALLPIGIDRRNPGPNPRRATMSAATEKLITPDNCAFIFIDHEPQMAFGVTSIDRRLLKNNVIAMAKLSEDHDT